MRDAYLRLRRLGIVLWLALLCCGQATAQAGEPELLPFGQAVTYSLVSRTSVIRLNARIADGYYLHRDSIRVVARTPGLFLGKPLLPAGETRDDPLLGPVQVYRGSATIELPLSTAPAPGTALSVAVTGQACADNGACHTPDTRVVTAAAPAGGAAGNSLTALERLGDSFAAVLGGSGDSDVEFLPVDEAFQLSAAADDAGAVSVNFEIADGYYLYRSRMSFEVQTPADALAGAPTMPAGTRKVDDYFGAQQVFYGPVTVRVPVAGAPAGALVELRVLYQGCADAGLCYPPQERTLAVTLNSAGQPSSGLRGPVFPASDASTSGVLSETDRLARSLTQDALGWVLGSFFLAGLLLAFTPCVLPMIPILSAIIAGQGEGSTARRGFALSLVYVLAMSATYTGAGVVAGLFGQNLQAFFQHPAVLVSFSAVFLVLALAMFGLFELQLPVALQTRLAALSHRQRGGSYLGVGVMGVLSALIVGPCVAAPLAAALIVIGSTGDPVRGGLALFSLSLGMGVPLLAVGIFGPALLPRAGAWMTLVRHVFAVMLLAVAVYLLGRVLPGPAYLGLWAGLALLTAVLFVRSGRGATRASSPGALRMTASAGAAVYALVLALGAVSGASDPLRPLDALARGGAAHTALDFTPVKTVAELDRMIEEATGSGRGAMLDFYADWCVSCKEMERDTFSDPAVRDALSGMLLLQADVTVYDDADRALLERFGLHGPPAILFFGPDGHEQRPLRVIGFMGPGDFAPHVTRAGGS